MIAKLKARLRWMLDTFLRFGLYRCPACRRKLWKGKCNCSGQWKDGFDLIEDLPEVKTLPYRATNG